MALFNRGWLAISGLAIVAAAPIWLSAAELGTYYAFKSLLTIQVFFDLGFNYIVMQVAAGEAAKIMRGPDGQMLESVARQRAVSLVRLLMRWYGLAASAYFVAVAIGGWLFFRSASTAEIAWFGPWLFLTVISAANLFLGVFLAVDEAFGRVHEVARVRLLSGMLGTALFIGSLWCGLRLWAVSLYALPLFAGACVWLLSRRSIVPELRNVAAAPGDARISWRREIFPFQWRLSLSWMSGYFIYEFMTPTIYKIGGPAEAAKFGLAVALCNGFMGFGIAWLNAMSPSLVHALENRDLDRMNALLRKGLTRSTLLLTLALACVVSLPWFAGLHWPGIAAKLPHWHVLALIALAALANHLCYGMATWLRAFRRELLAMASVTSAAFTCVGIVLAAPVSTALIPLIYAASICCILLPWTSIVFFVKQREARRAAAA